MTGANPQPAAAAPPDPPADEVTASAAPAPARPIWPIALAVFSGAYAAHQMVEFFLGVLRNPKMWIGMMTGSAPIGLANSSQWRLRIAVWLLYQLLVLVVIAPAIGLWLRRRWALWALSSWAVATLLVVLAIAVMSMWTLPMSAKSWLLMIAPGLLELTWLPAIVIIWISRPTIRRQFGQWVKGDLPAPLPIWAVIIGWLSMFHAVRGMVDVAGRVAQTVIQVVMTICGSLYGSLPMGASFNGWLGWVLTFVSGLLPHLAQAALVVPAIALLRRRPNAARLHVIGAAIVLGSVLAGPVVDALRGVHYFSGGPSVWSSIRDLIPTIYPLFLLYWFLRPGVKREVALWREPDAPGTIPADSERGS